MSFCLLSKDQTFYYLPHILCTAGEILRVLFLPLLTRHSLLFLVFSMFEAIKKRSFVFFLYLCKYN